MKYFWQLPVVCILGALVACGAPPQPVPVKPGAAVTLTSSQFNPELNSAITLTVKALPADQIAKLEILEGVKVLERVQNKAEYKLDLLMNKAGSRVFTARVVTLDNVVQSSAAVLVQTKTKPPALAVVANPVLQIVAGKAHTCVLLQDKTVRCWGDNSSGQLGLGDTRSRGANEAIRDVPALQFGTGFVPVKLVASAVQTCAISETGDAKCWGAQSSLKPDQVLNLIDFLNEKVKDIVSNSLASHFCAILESNKVQCWGDNPFGQLGDRSLVSRPLPSGVPIQLSSEAGVQISVGGQHTCALLADKSLHCWGRNARGQLGYGDTNTFGFAATHILDSRVVPVTDAAQVITGFDHTCIITTNRKLRCWGGAAEGQLGYGNTLDIGTTPSTLPESVGFVELGAEVSQMVAGGQFSCALLTNNTVKCWGNGTNGQLGYGNPNDIGDDELLGGVGLVSINTDPRQGKIMQLVAGAAHACALLESGNIVCWGDGSSGQLGYGIAGNTSNLGDNELPSTQGVVPLF